MAFKDDLDLKLSIADRAVDVLRAAGLNCSKTEALMDIDYVNEVCPLRLNELLNADDYDFAHDIFGIYRHFNRQTKQLEDCFLPRFAA